MTTDDTPRIYVASLSDYNAGTLHGRWIDATLTVEEINEQVQAMLAESPEARRFPQGGKAEEWAIHDYDNFGGLASTLGEYTGFERIAAIGEAIELHGVDAVEGYLSHDSTAELDELADRYRGEHDSWEAFVQDWVPEVDYLGLANLKMLANDGLRFSIFGHRANVDDMVDKLEGYLDWERIARDIDFEGLFWTHRAGGVVHVFQTG